MKRHLLLLVLVVCTTLTYVRCDDPPCGDNECPVSVSQEIAPMTEYRTYPNATTWVKSKMHCQTEKCMFAMRSSLKLYMRLFAYIRGFNSRDEILNMTAPVFFSYEPAAGYLLKMNFYIAAKDPPQPIKPFASLHTLPAGTSFYVRKFTTKTRINKAKFMSELNALKATLTGLNVLFGPEVSFRASYDKPMPGSAQYAEVWLKPLVV